MTEVKRRFSFVVKLIVTGVLTSLVWFANHVGDSDDVDQQDGHRLVSPAVSCGPRCLDIALRLLGVSCVEAQALPRFNQQPSVGTTLRDLADVAAGFDVTARLQRGRWTDLVEAEGVAILYLRNEHFVTVDCRDDTSGTSDDRQTIRVFDPNLPMRRMHRSELEAVWTGPMLALSARPRPGIQFETLYCDNGLILGQDETSYRIPIRNQGPSPVRIEVQGASCSCASAELTSEVVRPQSMEWLHVSVSLEQKRGRFRECVVLTSSDSDCESTVVTLCGAVPRVRVLSSQRIHLGTQDPGAEATREVGVYDRGDGQLIVQGVDVQLTEWTGDSSWLPSCAVVPIPFAETSNEQRDSLQLSAFDVLLNCRVTIPRRCLPGTFEFLLTVNARGLTTNQPSAVIRGVVDRDLEAFPAALIFESGGSGAALSRSTSIRSRSGLSLADVTTSVSSAVDASVETTIRGDQMDLEVTIMPPKVSPRQHYEGSVLCAFPDGRDISVPFIVQVGESVSGQ